MPNDCPLCTKSYESEKKLNRHCLKIHGKSLKELRAFCDQGGKEGGNILTITAEELEILRHNFKECDFLSDTEDCCGIKGQRLWFDNTHPEYVGEGNYFCDHCGLEHLRDLEDFYEQFSSYSYENLMKEMSEGERKQVKVQLDWSRICKKCNNENCIDRVI